MFQNFRLCIPLRVHGVSARRLTWWMGGYMHTGLYPFYGANHVFPEWHHNCVGSIILCGCVANKLGVITEYLVSLWYHIHHHLPYSTGHFQCIAYRALRQSPIHQYPMNIVSSRAPALMPFSATYVPRRTLEDAAPRILLLLIVYLNVLFVF